MEVGSFARARRDVLCVLVFRASLSIANCIEMVECVSLVGWGGNIEGAMVFLGRRKERSSVACCSFLLLNSL